jgi:hypothetical protein
MIRPSSILTRWKYELILSDVISGAVTASVIIISFLSMLSFADFLRVHWQQAPQDEQEGIDDRQQQPMPNDAADADGDDENIYGGVDEAAIDNDVGDYLEQHQPPEQEPENEERGGGDISNTRERHCDESGEGDAPDAVLRRQVAQLRDLALEREARQQAAAVAEREWIPLDDYVPVAPAGDGRGDRDDTDLVEPQRLNEAQNHLIEDMADEDDDEVALHDMDIDDDDDHDRLNWGQGDFDDENEGHAQRRPAEPEQDGAEAFDPMNAVVQDDQVVSRFLNLFRSIIYSMHAQTLMLDWLPSSGHGNQRSSR